MPYTDRKLELKAKLSVAQTASQAAVYAKGLKDNTANLFTVGPIFLRVRTIKTFPFFYVSGQEWRQLRKLASPAFRSSIVDVYFDVFRNNSEILVQTLKTKVGAGEFDVCSYLSLYALDNIIGEYIKL
jgi:cytochrome P450